MCLLRVARAPSEPVWRCAGRDAGRENWATGRGRRRPSSTWKPLRARPDRCSSRHPDALIGDAVPPGLQRLGGARRLFGVRFATKYVLDIVVIVVIAVSVLSVFSVTAARACRRRTDHVDQKQCGDHPEQGDERRQQYRLRHRGGEWFAQERGHRSAPAGVCPPPPGSSAPMRDVMKAAIAALPSTAPSCRVVLYTPELAPAKCGGRFRVAVAVNGAHTNAIPTPIAPNASASRQIGVPGAISKDSQVIPIASIEKPKPSTGSGGNRSMIMPTNGASSAAGDRHRSDQQAPSGSATARTPPARRTSSAAPSPSWRTR